MRSNSETFNARRHAAELEGRPLPAVGDAASVNQIDGRKVGKARDHVRAAYLASHQQYDWLYKKLAE